MPFGRGRGHGLLFPNFGSGRGGRTRPRAEATPARSRGDPVYRSGGGPAHWPIGAKRKVWKGSWLSIHVRTRGPTESANVIGRCSKRHRHKEFLAFLRLIDRETPPGLDLHLILGNYATHNHPKIRAWLAKRPRGSISTPP